MADITWADVEDMASDVAATPADAQTLILAHVNAYFHADSFGGADSPKYKLARIWLAAHIAMSTLPGTSGSAAGPVTSESGGRLSVSYASVVSATDNRSTTVYGRHLDELCRAGLARAWMVL